MTSLTYIIRPIGVVSVYFLVLFTLSSVTFALQGRHRKLLLGCHAHHPYLVSHDRNRYSVHCYISAKYIYFIFRGSYSTMLTLACAHKISGLGFPFLY